MMVRVPVPRSCVPISTSTPPSALMVVRHWLVCPPPPQALKPRPRPRFTGPRALAARIPQLLPLGHFGGLIQLVTVGILARFGRVCKFFEDLQRVQAGFGREILERAAGQIGSLLVVGRAPGADGPAFTDTAVWFSR